MIAPIYAPTHHSRPPTEREQADEAARVYSTKEEVREHFRAGAEWHIKKGESPMSGLEFLAMIFFMFMIISWSVSFLLGVSNIAFREEDYRYGSPASYIFWPYGVGNGVGKWLFKKVD